MKNKRLLLAVVAAMTFAFCQAQETVTVDMSEQSGQVSFWKSLVSDKNLYFSFGGDPTKAGYPDNDNECYAFIAVSQDEEYVYLRHITFVKAGTPIWIWGNRQVHYIYTFSTLQDLNDITGEDFSGYSNLEDVFENTSSNLLVGSASAATAIQLGDYVLSKQDDYVHAVTQAMVDGGNTLGAGKCLLRLGAAGSRATLQIGLMDDDEPTAIDAVCTRDGRLIMYDPTKPSFDAQGRPVAPGQKGLHIQNGYKFYIK